MFLKTNKTIFVSLILSLLLFSALFVSEAKAEEQNTVEVNFFKTETCQHCADEDEFLKDLEQKYPTLKVNRYPLHIEQNRELLQELAQKYDAEKYMGIVPVTFVGDSFFVGFDNPTGKGVEIENAIKKELGTEEQPPKDDPNKNTIHIPILGEIDPAKYSFPLLAITLGFLDGFNVCSLAALVLILTLVFALKSRGKILFFGGTFILTTSVIYGLLIILWHQLFSFFAPYLRILETGVALLSLGGGIFFFRQFLLFKKYGPTCSATAGDSFVSRSFVKIQKVFAGSPKAFVLFLGIFVFALIVTIIEFPCSAAVPVVFAGVLAKAQLPTMAYISYIALFVLFYMLDELIIFLIAVFKMSIWTASPKFTVWGTLAEALILTMLGLYYINKLFLL